MLLLPLLLGGLAACSSATVEENHGELCKVTLQLSEEYHRLEQELAIARQSLSALDVVVTRWGPPRLFPGGRIYVVGHHLGGEEGQVPRLRLQGTFTASRGLQIPLAGELAGEVRDGGERAEFPLEPETLAALGLAGEEGLFEGTAKLVVRVGDPPAPVEIPISLTFNLIQQLRPQLIQLSLAVPAGELIDVYPEDELTMIAKDLLLPGEGIVELVLDGEAQRGSLPKRRETYLLPVTAETDRSDGQAHFAAQPFSILPGSMVGQARLRETTNDGRVWESAPINVRLRVEKPVISGIEPIRASRGQWVSVLGRGFLPPSVDGNTLLHVEGEFWPDSGGSRSYVDEISPDVFVDNGRMRYAIRTVLDASGRGLAGLGAAPGRFLGKITPIITWGRHEVEGVPWEEGFAIAPTRQVVYLKYLPSFTVSLNATWGLKNVERQLRQHILDVCQRDYTGINILFTDERPREYLEYTVIEVGGPDPNGRDLFGLDNTTGEEGESPKDVNNLRLREVIGGKNARAEEEGYLAYGGVFLESFRYFSTWLPEPISLASPRFDDIFSGIAPFLCGVPVEPDEYPDGPRAGEITETITVLGNMVGNTISHEVGHSLGLSLPYGPPHEFHNLFDTPNAMMDSGQDRPFEERAEIDGQGPQVFEEENRRYLEEILPVDR